MRHIAFGVVVGVMLVNAGAFAACAVDSEKDHHPARKPAKPAPCVNFSGVPQISADVVAAEPAPAAKPRGYAPPSKQPYEGPTFSFTKPDPGVKPVPTVGYHWSLE